MVASVVDGRVGYCEHEPLRTHSDETRALLGRLLRIAGAAADFDVPTDDVVHFDFSHANVLSVDGEAHHGRRRLGGHDDRRRGLRSRHARALHLRAAPHATRCSRLRPDRTDARVLPLYAAHMVLRQVDWSLRNADDFTIRWWLDLGDRAVWPPSALGSVAVMIELPTLTLHELADGVFVWLQPGGESGVSNAGVIVDDDGLTVVDTLMVRVAVGAVRGRGRTASAAPCAGSCSRTRTSTTSAAPAASRTRWCSARRRRVELLDGEMPVDAYKSFMPAFDDGVRRARRDRHAARSRTS